MLVYCLYGLGDTGDYHFKRFFSCSSKIHSDFENAKSRFCIINAQALKPFPALRVFQHPVEDTYKHQTRTDVNTLQPVLNCGLGLNWRRWSSEERSKYLAVAFQRSSLLRGESTCRIDGVDLTPHWTSAPVSGTPGGYASILVVDIRVKVKNHPDKLW